MPQNHIPILGAAVLGGVHGDPSRGKTQASEACVWSFDVLAEMAFERLLGQVGCTAASITLGGPFCGRPHNQSPAIWGLH